MNSIKSIVLAVIFWIAGVPCFSQLDICKGDSSALYLPIKIGVKMHYFTQNGPYVSFFPGDTLKALGNVYFKEIEEHSNGEKKTNYYREQNENIYTYNPDKKEESLELSANTRLGYTWETSNKLWKYTVVDTNSSVSTPYCDYTHLLNIKAEPQNQTKNKYSSYYNLYYKRGLGLVNLSVSGKGYSFLSVDKSLDDERGYIFNGCETLETENERIDCTTTKVNDFIFQNFDFPGILRKGTILLRFTITESGKVEDIVAEKTIKKANGQLQEAIRIVNKITFIPRKLNGKPVKTVVYLPITF